MTTETSTRYTGTIVHVAPSNDWGFARCVGVGDIWIHAVAFRNNVLPEIGTTITFEIELHRGRQRARSARGVERNTP